MIGQFEIQRVGLEGQGIAYDAAGNIYFIPGALPGECVDAEYDDAAKRYRDAILTNLVRASKERVESPCVYFKQCGGCDWLDWDYDAQIKAKEHTLAHVLERGSVSPKEMLPMVRAEKTSGYRNRIQVRSNGEKLGFFKKRSHDIVDIESCYVAHPKLNDKIKELRAELVGETKTQKTELALTEEGKVSVMVNRPHAALGFQQIHTEQNRALQEIVVGLAQKRHAKEVFELFCGSGNLTFPLLSVVERIIAVDASEEAIAFAKQKRDKLSETEIPKVGFFVSRVDKGVLKKFPAEFRGRYDTLILDPPRTGLTQLGVKFEDVLAPKVKNVIYVSCSPVEFSKDAQALKECFDFVSVQPIDMFPHTRHIEFVALFSR